MAPPRAEKADDVGPAVRSVEAEAGDDSAGSAGSRGGLWSRLGSKAVLLEVDESRVAPAGSRWSNGDLDPIPPERQTWKTYNFVTYWITDAFALSNWRLGSSLVAIGLSWKLALVAVIVGNVAISLVMTWNGLIGARLHVPYTVQARSAFGFYFSYVMVVMRVVVSVFWYGISTYNGAECVRSIVYAWAPSFRYMPNTLPASAHVESNFLLCYFIYFLMVLPFHWIPAHRLHWLFTVKSVVCPVAGFAMVGWVVASTGGGDQVFSYGNTKAGSALGWAFLSGVNAVMGGYATLGVNMNDFARYSRSPRAPYVQLVVMPVAFAVVMLFGIIGANGSRLLYGQILWDPLLMADQWTSPAGRAAAFFLALAFLLATIGTAIGANSVSVAVDLATLFPRWVNLRRGQYICAFVGVCMTPWNILRSAETLLNFMSGYSIFLAPISSVLIADYWLVHRARVSVPDMYRPDGMYAYERWGTNWRAAAAYVVGFVPVLPGLAAALSPALAISDHARHLYAIAYAYGFVSSMAVYLALNRLFPPRSEITGKTLDESLNEMEAVMD